MKPREPEKGDLRVWWIPQVPMQPFHVEVKTIHEAKLILNTLADYDLFQFNNHIKPDYCNTGGLEVYELDPDGTGKPDWIEWYDKDDNCIDDYYDEGVLKE